MRVISIRGDRMNVVVTEDHGRTVVRLWKNGTRECVWAGNLLSLPDAAPVRDAKIADACRSLGIDPGSRLMVGQMCLPPANARRLVAIRNRYRLAEWSTHPEEHNPGTIVLHADPAPLERDSIAQHYGDAIKATEDQRYLLEPFVRDRLPEVLIIHTGMESHESSVQRNLHFYDGAWRVVYEFPESSPFPRSDDPLESMFRIKSVPRVSYRVHVLKTGNSVAYDWGLLVNCETEWLTRGMGLQSGVEVLNSSDMYCWWRPTA